MRYFLKIGFTALLCASGIGANTAFAQDLKIGLLLPQSAGAVNAERVISILSEAISSSGVKVEIVFEDTGGNPALASQRFKALTSLEGVNLVVGPVYSEVARAIIPLAEKLDTPLLVLTSDATGALENLYRESDWATGFGNLPQNQIQIIESEIKARGAQFSSAAVAVVGLGPEAQRIAAMVDQTVPRGWSIEGPAYPKSFGEPTLDEFVDVMQKDQVIVGLSHAGLADRFYETLAENDSNSSMILFQVPPLETRAYVLGRAIGWALKDIGSFDAAEFMDAIRRFERYDSDRASLELNYSMTVYRASDSAESATAEAAMNQRGNIGSSQASSTEACSCRDSKNKLKNCIDCKPESCSKKNDGEDSCTTSCN